MMMFVNRYSQTDLLKVIVITNTVNLDVQFAQMFNLICIAEVQYNTRYNAIDTEHPQHFSYSCM